MSLDTPDRTSTATRKHTIKPVQREPEGWWPALGGKGQKAFKAAFAGYTLDAFDLIILTLTLSAIGSTFGSFEIGYAASVSVVMTLVILVITSLQLLASRRLVSY